MAAFHSAWTLILPPSASAGVFLPMPRGARGGRNATGTGLPAPGGWTGIRACGLGASPGMPPKRSQVFCLRASRIFPRPFPGPPKRVTFAMHGDCITVGLPRNPARGVVPFLQKNRYGAGVVVRSFALIESWQVTFAVVAPDDPATLKQTGSASLCTGMSPTRRAPFVPKIPDVTARVVYPTLANS